MIVIYYILKYNTYWSSHSREGLFLYWRYLLPAKAKVMAKITIPTTPHEAAAKKNTQTIRGGKKWKHFHSTRQRLIKPKRGKWFLILRVSVFVY